MDSETLKCLARAVVKAERIRHASYVTASGNHWPGRYTKTVDDCARLAAPAMSGAAIPLITFLVHSGEGVDVCRAILGE